MSDHTTSESEAAMCACGMSRYMHHGRPCQESTTSESGTVIREHFDAQDDRVAIAYMPDCGVGPAVCFDGGGFTNAQALRAFAGDLIDLARRLDPPCGDCPPNCSGRCFQ